MSHTIDTPAGPVRQGDRVVLAKGAHVSSTNPSKKRYELKRRQIVKVRIIWPHHPGVDGSAISWAGVGGYWCDTAASNLEKVL